MRPIEHWMPPSAAGKDAPVGGLRATYAHAAAHLRCALPCHMPHKRLRLIDCAPILAHSRVLGARLDQSASGQRRMHADYTGTLEWNTCTSPAKHNAMCHVSWACAACGVLRSAPGASSPQIVGFWPFAAAVRTLRRPRLAGEARPAAHRWVRRCAPVASGARGVWEALERPAPAKRDFT